MKKGLTIVTLSFVVLLGILFCFSYTSHASTLKNNHYIITEGTYHGEQTDGEEFIHSKIKHKNRYFQYGYGQLIIISKKNYVRGVKSLQPVKRLLYRYHVTTKRRRVYSFKKFLNKILGKGHSNKKWSKGFHYKRKFHPGYHYWASRMIMS